MSVYNDIVRRPHLPREEGVRRILSSTGIDLSQYGRGSSDGLEEEEPAGEEGDGAECEEEEAEETDPCI